ncbi:UNVERIFIED_CONTAM: hypothetical protein Sindi_1917500 [Sesamum indicum]
MAGKIVVVLFLLLLLMGGEDGFALCISRKLMVDVGREERVDHMAAEAVPRELEVEQAAATESSAAADPGVENHHSIPRESWDSGQNKNGPAAGVQSYKDGNAAGNHG